MDILHVIYIFFAIFAGIFGVVIGSFLNVVIYRVPAGRTISKGHSMCMTCGHNLGPADLIPLLSWALLKGKCRYCGAPIASRYSKIEGLTGVFFLITALTHLEASLYIIDYTEPLFVLWFIYFCMFLVAGAAVISAMMIYYDTGKGFIGLPVCTIVLGLLSNVVTSFYTEFNAAALFKNLGFDLIYIAGFIGLTYLAFLIAKKEYARTDLFFDLTFIGMMLFTDYLSFSKPFIIIPCYALVCATLRAVLKNKKNDKYVGIIMAALIVIYMLIRYFIIVSK